MKKMSMLALFAIAALSLVLTGCESMKKAGLCCGLCSSSSEGSNPFDVSVGGQKAGNYSNNCAKIAKPVLGDAELEVHLKPESDVIINIFKCNNMKECKVASGTQAEVIIIKNKGTKIKLSDKMKDKAPLKPGCYLMNVVANGNTSRVCFEVK